MNREYTPLLRVISVFILLLLLIISRQTIANQKISHQNLLAEIVPTIEQIMRKNGYEMVHYRVVGGHTDVPISGPPEKHAFFGYVDEGWLMGSEKIILKFYEADQLPVSGRLQVINYLLKVYEEKNYGFKLSLYMTKARYRKPQPIMPETFLEMNFN